MKNITVGTAITAIDLEDETIIGVFPQSLYFGESMKDSLLPPAQMWDYGMVVDVVPKQYSSGKSLHGIYHHDEKIIVPFSMHGCMSYIPTRLPSREEKRTCRWIQFTGEKEWKPYDKKFDLAERAMINHVTEPDLNHQHGYNDNIQINRRSMGRVSVTSQNDNIKDHEPSLYTFDTIYNDNIREAKAINARNHRSKVDDVTLAKRWGVSVDIAKRTKQLTTQRGIRTLTGNIGRRFRTRQHQLSSPLIMTKVYSDTMFSDTTSVLGNTCAQLHMTSEGYATGDVMKSKADAHISLGKLCREDGIPHVLVTDRAKEELYGEWGKIIKRNLIDQRTTEPHSGWQNKVEAEIREFKKHHNRIMAQHKCPDAF